MNETRGQSPGWQRGFFPREKRVAFKTRSGHTLLASRPPLHSDREIPTAKETLQESVRQAVTYAEFASTETIYQCKALGTTFSAYHLAVEDFLEKPQVLDIDIRRWMGGIGQEIQIKARDDFMVLSVRLVIRDHEMIWETGEATQSESNSLLWTYITRTPVAREPGLWIDAYACDLPGNVGEYHLELR
jgi:hypothetical protein